MSHFIIHSFCLRKLDCSCFVQYFDEFSLGNMWPTCFTCDSFNQGGYLLKCLCDKGCSFELNKPTCGLMANKYIGKNKIRCVVLRRFIKYKHAFLMIFSCEELMILKCLGKSKILLSAPCETNLSSKIHPFYLLVDGRHSKTPIIMLICHKIGRLRP